MYNFATKMPQEEYHEYLFGVLREQKDVTESAVLTWISRNFSASTGGPWSIGWPEPLKTLPSISTLMGIRRTSPVNSQVVLWLSMPAVPSKIYGKTMISLICNSKNLPGRQLAFLWSQGPDPSSRCHLQAWHWRSLRILGTWRCQGRQAVPLRQGRFCNQCGGRCCNLW